MAFDMYLGDRHEKIDHHEDFIFTLIGDGDAYPELARIWTEFYSNFVIAPEQANRLVHELILLVATAAENQVLTRLVLRLLPFFSAAYVSGQGIQCHGD